MEEIDTIILNNIHLLGDEAICGMLKGMEKEFENDTSLLDGETEYLRPLYRKIVEIYRGRGNEYKEMEPKEFPLADVIIKNFNLLNDNFIMQMITDINFELQFPTKGDRELRNFREKCQDEYVKRGHERIDDKRKY